MTPLTTNDADEAIRREYDRLAWEYDRRWSFYVQTTLNETLKWLSLEPSTRILDIGCGTGSLFEIISSKYCGIDLVGIDLSVEMLRVAFRRPLARATFATSRAQALPFCSNSFDTVISCNTFHYWRSPEVCLAEIRRVLRPGGRLVITDWCHDYLACRICDFFLRLINHAHFRTYGTEECKRLVKTAGFHRVHIERYKISWLWGLMTAVT